MPEINKQPIIEISRISKRYKKSDDESLKNVTFQIDKGEKFGIFGPNGAGKTTLISILSGVIQPTNGNFKYHLDLPEMSNSIQPFIGIVPQELALYNELTAWQNIEYFGALYNIRKDELHKRGNDILQFLGLSAFAGKKVKTFSGGMKRRLNLAIGILHKPMVLFLDEPTEGVDIQSKNAIISFLNQLNESGTTIIYTSHLLFEAEEFCSTIAILDNGRLIEAGTVENLKIKHNALNLKEIYLKLTGVEYRDYV